MVAPTELTRETPYLKDHIAATRAAWGLDSVGVPSQRRGRPTLADIRANSATIENVRLWDRDPLLQTFGQLQEIRTYYDFVSVDDDRYWIDGKYRQVLLSPRELNPASLPTRTFINEHLTFTHGMGLTLGPVNQVTTEGLPVLFIRDLPPVSDVSLKVTRPQIYYGEIANDFVFVGTKQREFDHPSGEANVYASYEGSGGVKVGNPAPAGAGGAVRLVQHPPVAGHYQRQPGALLSEYRRAGAGAALPPLRSRSLHGGHHRRPPRVDCRRVHDLRRLSLRPAAGRRHQLHAEQRQAGHRCLRRLAHRLCERAGRPDDPHLGQNIPGIFQPLDSMPADLRSHIRYPDDLYRVQTTSTSYHMEAPEDFYHREDQWQIPTVAEAQASVPFMRHIVMRLPDEPKAEFIYMVPFTPRGKDNRADGGAERR